MALSSTQNISGGISKDDLSQMQAIVSSSRTGKTQIAYRQVIAMKKRWVEFLAEIEEVNSIEELLTSKTEVLRELGKRLKETRVEDY